MQNIERILLVDDSETSNFLHARLISRINPNIVVDIVLNGRKAIDYLKETDTPPDLIILDINMPVMNGFEFMDEYKTMDPSKKAKKLVSMLTASTANIHIKMARELGYSKLFIKKPLSKEKLVDIINKAISIE
ncbi:MAG: response regulator [Flavobacteriales bacterium]|nr:response regulator [Flavobacteriales bacterium]